MIERFARLHPPAPRRFTATQRLQVRIVEGLGTLGVLIFACTLPPAVTFIAGMGWTLVLLELAKWEAARGA